MKLRSMEEKISYRLFLMGFLGLLFTAALCIFVFHKAFTAQAWTSLEREADLVSAGYDLVQDPQQLSSFVTNDLRPGHPRFPDHGLRDLLLCRTVAQR